MNFFKIKSYLIRTYLSIKHNGIKQFSRNVYRRYILKENTQTSHNKDILFINGCSLDHPARYRVNHQYEQLEMNGLRCDSVWYEDLTMDMLNYYRGFIIYRCIYTDLLRKFIKKGKLYNKIFFFDIDDLVFDEKLVKTIAYVQDLRGQEKKDYFYGVRGIKKLMPLCDYGITTTRDLKKELDKYYAETIVNKNSVSEEMVKYSLQALKDEPETSHTYIKIGYLSGSITHNPDFEMIKHPIIRILQEHPNTRLVLAGYIDLPEELIALKSQIEIVDFTEWQKLPSIIADLDISLAPLQDSVFNRAKSENRWTEAALVKRPTIASNIGAFAEVIRNGIDGLLVENNPESWYEAISSLIENPDKRWLIGDNAYKRVIKEYVTAYTGQELAQWIKSKLRRNFLFVLPSMNISGGVMVACKHALMLRNHGYDVTILSKDKQKPVLNEEGGLPAFCLYNTDVSAKYDTIVATLYDTVDFVLRYPFVKNRLYLVQNFETDFYRYTNRNRLIANGTYSLEPYIKYITISKWCKTWLQDNFKQEVKYAPNGIDLSTFTYKGKDLSESKTINVLIEGDSKSHYKNVDESFIIVKELLKIYPREKFHITYMSYEGNPKPWYILDKFLHKVKYSEVYKVYQDNHILLKSSILESFSYPPLEMMATGGIAVVAENGGNSEYLKHAVNAMVYESGNIQQAIDFLDRVIKSRGLRKKLIRNGLDTAKKRSWMVLKEEIVQIYE